jgi:hypothetical protein
MHQAGAVLQRLAEVRSERTAPVYFLRRALETILMDSCAIYGSLQIISDAQDLAIMLVTAGESPSEAFLETNRAQWLLVGGDTAYAARKLCKRLEATAKASKAPSSTPRHSPSITSKDNLVQEESHVDPKALMLGWSREKERALASSASASISTSQISSTILGTPGASLVSQPSGIPTSALKEARKKVPMDWQQLVRTP